MKELIVIKIGRHEYKITHEDYFVDNGACVQLLTQSNEKSEWGRRPHPVLSKRAVKEISKYDRVQKKHNYDNHVSIFSLR